MNHCQNCGTEISARAKYCLKKECQNVYHKHYRRKERAKKQDFYNGMSQEEYLKWIMDLAIPGKEKEN